VAPPHRIPVDQHDVRARQAHLSLGELSQGIIDLPLAIPNVLIQTGPAPQHVRSAGCSVNNVQHAFAVQSFIAGLAPRPHARPRDMLLAIPGPPVDGRSRGVEGSPTAAPLSKHPIDVARFHRVIRQVTRAASGTPRAARPRARPRRSPQFPSAIAVVARVSGGPRGGLRVEGWIAADAGTIIHADRGALQLEGAFVFR
jgi:isoquinoline 1-oxidoreductase beta subunit